jgi:hypothetical protein
MRSLGAKSPLYVSQTPQVPIKFSTGIVVQQIPVPSSQRMGENSALLNPDSDSSSFSKSCLSVFISFFPSLFLLVILILSLAVLLLFNPVEKDLEGGLRILKVLTKNHGIAPIKTISTIPASSNICPTSQVLLPIFLFEGIKSGCLCEGSPRMYSKAYCLENEGRCTFVEETEKKELYIWKGRKICAERYLPVIKKIVIFIFNLFIFKCSSIKI